jgi:hypothetical protein
MIRRLREFRSAKRYTLPQLKLAMDAPFTWPVLRNALGGKPIWILNYEFIEKWLDQFVPAAPAPAEPESHDGKLAAAGRDD